MISPLPTLVTAKVFTSLRKKREKKLSGEGGNDFIAVLSLQCGDSKTSGAAWAVCWGSNSPRPDQRCLNSLSDFGPRLNSIRLLSVETKEQSMWTTLRESSPRMRVPELSPPRGAENHQENATLGPRT